MIINWKGSLKYSVKMIIFSDEEKLHKEFKNVNELSQIETNRKGPP